MQQLYFEDIELHEQKVSPEYLVTKEEIIEYARKWDPQPFHIDEEKAKSSPFGGLIASASHITAISFWLLNRAGKGIAVISGLGWDRMRLPNPVRPGDRLSLTMECIEKRPSKTSLDRGILLHSVVVSNQEGVPVSTFETATLVVRTPLPVEPQSR
ncbi:MAG: MaoC/PaaZ C-terminal domain-containing protein [Dehalococcoidia bacterium]